MGNRIVVEIGEIDVDVTDIDGLTDLLNASLEVYESNRIGEIPIDKHLRRLANCIRAFGVGAIPLHPCGLDRKA